jgi:hypothetical protein
MSSLLVFNRVYRLEIQSVLLVFSIPPVNCCPSTFYLTSPTPPLLPKVNVQYIQTVCGCGGVGGVWGVLRCVVDHILQVFNTAFQTKSRTYKIATPPQTKTPVKTTFRNWCLGPSSFVHGSTCLTTLKKDRRFCLACRLCLECRPLPRFPPPRRQDRPPPLGSGARWRAPQQNSHSACNKKLTNVACLQQKASKPSSCSEAC